MDNNDDCVFNFCCLVKLFFLHQMQQLGNMKDNFDDLSDPEQFACLVSFYLCPLLMEP